MKRNDNAGIENLERIFHEPSRFAILSALCAAEKGLTFTELKESCDLTDGNLSRHLSALEEDGVVRIDKRFVDSKPRTTVYLSKAGLDRFRDYLDSLATILASTRKSLPAPARRAARA